VLDSPQWEALLRHLRPELPGSPFSRVTYVTAHLPVHRARMMDDVRDLLKSTSAPMVICIDGYTTSGTAVGMLGIVAMWLRSHDDGVSIERHALGMVSSTCWIKGAKVSGPVADLRDV
jgi:hypothetical protein